MAAELERREDRERTLPLSSQSAVNSGVNSPSIESADPGVLLPPTSGSFALDTLGTLRLRGPAGEHLVGPRKELVLLAYIARHAPRPVAREQLAALLWGERREANARHSLRQAILRLRRELGDCFVVGPERISLVAGVLQVDATLFEADLTAGRLADAVRRWGGDFLSGVEDAGTEEFRLWLEAEREGLRKRLAWALERLVRECEGRGQRASALGWAERWAELFPTDEHAHGRAIELLRSTGRADDAAGRHASFVVRLREETGREQSPELQRLGALLDRDLRKPRAHVRDADAPQLFSPDLVGRGPVLDRLADAWSAARAGSPQLVLIEGEQGIGKSRLCEEFLKLTGTRAPRTVILQARASQLGSDAAGTLAHELLAPLADAPGLVGASPQALADLATLVPAIRHKVGVLPNASGDAWAAHDALAEALRAVSEEEPILLFVDDLRQGDEQSQRLILSAISRAPQARMMAIVSAQTDDLRSWKLADQLMVASYGSGCVRRIRLEPLSRPDVERLIASMLALPEVDLQTLAARIHEEAGGNPFFVTEILSELAEDGYLSLTADGALRLAPSLANRPLPQPATVHAAVARRLSTLGVDARLLIDQATSVGSVFELTSVATAAGLSRAALYAALDELVGRRLVRELDPGTGRYAFTHDLIYRAALARVESSPGSGSAPSERESAPPADTRAGSPASATHGAPIGGSGGGNAVGPPSDVNRLRSGRAAANPKRSDAGRRLAVGIAIGLVAVGALAARLTRLRPDGPAVVVLAVGPIAEYLDTDSAKVGAALVDMLATNLARVQGLQVVSNARLYDLLGDVGADGSRATLIHVAKVAGASELVEGALHRRSGGVFRLDLQRVDLESGTIRRAFTVEGTDVFALVDTATAQIAGSLRVSAGPLRVADVTTQSLLAYRLYEEGLRAYYRNSDVRSAAQLFAAAVAEDSTFAMAAYYQARLAESVGGPMFELLASADAKAVHASERERLIIRASAALQFNEPAALAVAESLAVRYPADPSGHYLMGVAKVAWGDFLGALPELRRAVDMDSLAFRGSVMTCRACDAMSEMTTAYWRADSLPAAERVAREWTRRQPTSATAWESLAGLLQWDGRYAEARPIFDTIAHLMSGPVRDGRLDRALFAIRDGNFAEGDRLLNELIREKSLSETGELLWYVAISLRAQGRLHEALEAARRVRALGGSFRPGDHINQDALQEAQILLESGRPRAAAALFDSLLVITVTPDKPYMRSRNARGKTWFLTHVATALAAAGDTLRLKRLADNIEEVGRQSAYGRDRVLHHHARGLLAVARGRMSDAAQEFQLAIYSPTLGYTRTNAELARVLMSLGRPREAVQILQPALRGVLDASNMYVTRTSIHEALAQAFDQAGERDSAAAHYRQVVSAWRASDASFRPRVAAATRRLASLTRTESH